LQGFHQGAGLIHAVVVTMGHPPKTTTDAPFSHTAASCLQYRQCHRRLSTHRFLAVVWTSACHHPTTMLAQPSCVAEDRAGFSRPFPPYWFKWVTPCSGVLWPAQSQSPLPGAESRCKPVMQHHAAFCLTHSTHAPQRMPPATVLPQGRPTKATWVAWSINTCHGNVSASYQCCRGISLAGTPG
jgi:hypothetical protein